MDGQAIFMSIVNRRWRVALCRCRGILDPGKAGVCAIAAAFVLPTARLLGHGGRDGIAVSLLQPCRRIVEPPMRVVSMGRMKHGDGR